jgi:uncharacterized membrane protein
MLQRLSRYFLAGLLALLPLVFTIAVVGFVYTKLVEWLGPESHFGGLIQSISESTALPPSVSYLMTFALVVTVTMLIGMFASRFTGQRILAFFNQLIARIPFINKVYSSADQVVRLFNSKDGDAVSALSDVVLAKIANTYVMGMLANSEPVIVAGRPHVFFYMPSAPLPATGILYLVPAEDIFDVDLSVEELTRVVVSLGSLGPAVFQSNMLVEQSLTGNSANKQH